MQSLDIYGRKNLKAKESFKNSFLPCDFSIISSKQSRRSLEVCKDSQEVDGLMLKKSRSRRKQNETVTIGDDFDIDRMKEARSPLRNLELSIKKKIELNKVISANVTPSRGSIVLPKLKRSHFKSVLSNENQSLLNKLNKVDKLSKLNNEKNAVKIGKEKANTKMRILFENKIQLDFESTESCFLFYLAATLGLRTGKTIASTWENITERQTLLQFHNKISKHTVQLEFYRVNVEQTHRNKVGTINFELSTDGNGNIIPSGWVGIKTSIFDKRGCQIQPISMKVKVDRAS